MSDRFIRTGTKYDTTGFPPHGKILEFLYAKNVHILEFHNNEIRVVTGEVCSTITF